MLWCKKKMRKSVNMSGKKKLKIYGTKDKFNIVICEQCNISALFPNELASFANV